VNIGEVLNSVLIWSLLLLALNGTAGSVLRVVINRRSLRRGPGSWMRSRGIDASDADVRSVVWVCGQVGGKHFINLPAVAVVATKDTLFLESQVPNFIRRGRASFSIGQQLHVWADGIIVLPKRNHAITSYGDSSLLPRQLQSLGWDLVEIP